MAFGVYDTRTEKWYKERLRPWLFKKSKEDVEIGHDKALWFLERLDGMRPISSPLLWWLDREYRRSHSMLHTRMLGMDFETPFGLAAGFTKGSALRVLTALGFGHIEIGGITAIAQPGNPRPRVLRSRDGQALWNWKGFNNWGIYGAQLALSKYRHGLPIPIFLNIGKGKDTPLVQAPKEYATIVRGLWGYVQALTINPSSPNTKDLRNLLQKQLLEDLLGAIQAVNTELARRENPPDSAQHKLPVGVKFSPDMTDAEAGDSFEVCAKKGVAYIVLTNTSAQHGGYGGEFPEDKGGISGDVLRERSHEMLRLMYPRAREHGIALIGVGGIRTARHLYDRITAGANLCQGLSAWPREGPDWVKRLNRGLVEHLRADGFDDVDEAVGAIHH